MEIESIAVTEPDLHVAKDALLMELMNQNLKLRAENEALRRVLIEQNSKETKK